MNNTRKTDNPYPNRPYPVGQLYYNLSSTRAAKVAALEEFCLLEFGEAEVLFDMPRLLGFGGNYLNLGHGQGGSAMCLAAGLNYLNMPGIVHSIDMFSTNSGHLKHVAEASLVRTGLDQRVKLYRGLTLKYVEMVSKMELSFLFIDADHSYEGVKADFLAFSPFVKINGAVAFHDTNQEPSHTVIKENIAGNPTWEQMNHVNRIKTFKRVK